MTPSHDWPFSSRSSGSSSRWNSKEVLYLWENASNQDILRAVIIMNVVSVAGAAAAL
jgi:hypothetical protein